MCEKLQQYQVQQYNDEIDKLNSDYLAGKYSATEYADKLAELTSAQWDAVNAAESAKDAIMKLNEARVEKEIEGIEKEIDAYKELIDAQIDALKAAKDLHDYEESIAEKTKSITNLERQIAAMQNDNTAATVAKRKKLEEELAQAKKDLEDAEYDHSIETQENALNEEYERFEEEKNAEIDALRESLNEIEQMIAESLEAVKQNSDLIGQEIAYIAQTHGITVSDALISAWKNGENAVAGYGEVLSAGTSAFIGNVIGVENEVWNLQAQANNTADTLAWMFSTRADSLVDELNRSYNSEENLNAMTNALQSTLINTLERGYDISGITSALSAIASGADSVADAANRATDALAGMGAAGNNGNTGGKKLTFVEIDSSTGESIYRNNENGMEETAQFWKTYGWQYDIPEEELANLPNYASGTRNSKGGLIIKDEEGYEMELPKLDNGNYTIASEGTQILTKRQTDNLFRLADINPDYLIKEGKGKKEEEDGWVVVKPRKEKEFIPLPIKKDDMEPGYWDKQVAELNQMLYTQNPFYNSSIPGREAYTNIKYETNNNNPVSVEIGNMVGIHGNVSNYDEKKMEKVANRAVEKLTKELNYMTRFGRS